MGDRWRPDTGEQYLKDTEKRLNVLERRPRGGGGVTAGVKLGTIGPNGGTVIAPDGTILGPYPYARSYLPVPGDQVWLVPDGNGGYVIGGGRNETKKLTLFSNAITYGQGWNDNNWEEPTYTIRNGIVQLNGLVATTLVTPYTAVLFTLPPEARPDRQMIIAVDRGGACGALYIKTNGDVAFESGFLANTYISLSHVMYPVAGRATWTPVPASWYVNGWVDFEPVGTTPMVFGPASYWVDEFGHCWLSGMIKGGTMGANAWNVPAGHPILGDKNSGHVFTTSAGITGFVYIPNNVSRVLQVGSTGANNWVTLSGCAWPTATEIASMSWLIGMSAGSPGGAAQGPSSFIMGSSWVNYDETEASWSKFKIGQRGDGMVITRGLMKTGTLSSTSQLTWLKDEYTRRRSNILTTISNTAYARLDFSGRDYSSSAPQNRNSVVTNNGSSAWYSMDGVKWFPE